MSKVLSNLRVLVTLFFVVSCGVGKNSSLNHEAQLSYFKASEATGTCGGEKAISLDKSASELIETIKNQSTLQGLQYLIQTNSMLERHGNFLTPIILGSHEIESSIDELRSLYEREAERSFVGTNWLTLLEKADFLDMSIKRWTFHQCHLTNLVDSDSQELSDYLEIESLYCTEGCVESDFRRAKLNDKELRKKFISMCSLVERRNSCAVKFDIATLNKLKTPYIQEKLSHVKNYFEKAIYGIKNPAFDFSCKKNTSSQYELTIPIKAGPGKFELENAIRKFWESDKLVVKFSDSEQGVRLQYSSEVVSRVESTNPHIILLNGKLSGDFRVKTIAHEFGHVLGFRDCYIEYYDTSKEEIIYYELERSQGNLMCSLSYGTNIPKKYSEILIQRFCN
ncbi:hypothetical protein A9Q84_08720 [Halobacteriovorax marinus]|uniref:Lipoprotein n=1 Tax=Halobacteriovorax marinus TaxID=97084 RepID=A0A1Y5F6Q8_9BACT|nr:hypothetical protein A9Q84_08720 [Halobacteriovorax marinus]